MGGLLSLVQKQLLLVKSYSISSNKKEVAAWWICLSVCLSLIYLLTYLPIYLFFIESQHSYPDYHRFYMLDLYTCYLREPKFPVWELIYLFVGDAWWVKYSV